MKKVTRIMIFVDGNYLQRGMKEKYPQNEINYSAFPERFSTYLVSRYLPETIPDLIRTYYYDAVHVDSEREKPEHKIFLDSLRNTDSYEVRVGRVKIDGEGRPRQKGVDTLVALDMVSKAYEDHYDTAILIAGDDDFVDIVNAVKNAGKRVIGAFFDKHVSPSIKQSFDYKALLDDNFFLHWGVLGAKQYYDSPSKS